MKLGYIREIIDNPREYISTLHPSIIAGSSIFSFSLFISGGINIGVPVLLSLSISDYAFLGGNICDSPKYNIFIYSYPLFLSFTMIKFFGFISK